MSDLFPKLEVEITWMMDCKEITFLPDTNFSEMRMDISNVWRGNVSQDTVSPPQAKIKDLLRQVEKTTSRHLAAIEKLYSYDTVVFYSSDPFDPSKPEEEVSATDTYIPPWLDKIHQNLSEIKKDTDTILAAAPVKFKSGAEIDRKFLNDIKSLSYIFEKYTGNKATSQSVIFCLRDSPKE